MSTDTSQRRGSAGIQTVLAILGIVLAQLYMRPFSVHKDVSISFALLSVTVHLQSSLPVAMKITLALLFATFTSITTVLAVAVAAPPPGVPSYQGPPTKKLHEIREEAMAEMKNATLVRRDSYGDGTFFT